MKKKDKNLIKVIFFLWLFFIVLQIGFWILAIPPSIPVPAALGRFYRFIFDLIGVDTWIFFFVFPVVSLVLGIIVSLFSNWKPSVKLLIILLSVLLLAWSYYFSLILSD